MGRDVKQGKSLFCQVCGHRYCGNGDIFVLVSHLILQHHVTKGWSNIMGRSPHGKLPACQVWWP